MMEGRDVCVRGCNAFGRRGDKVTERAYDRREE